VFQHIRSIPLRLGAHQRLLRSRQAIAAIPQSQPKQAGSKQEATRSETPRDISNQHLAEWKEQKKKHMGWWQGWHEEITGSIPICDEKDNKRFLSTLDNTECLVTLAFVVCDYIPGRDDAFRSIYVFYLMAESWKLTSC